MDGLAVGHSRERRRGAMLRGRLCTHALIATLLTVLAACGARTGLIEPDLGGRDGSNGDSGTGPRTNVSSVTDTANSYLGTEFWAVTTANGILELGNRFHFAIAIGNPNSIDVTVTITGAGLTAPLVSIVPAGSTATIVLPWMSELTQNTTMFSDCGSSLRVPGVPARSARLPNGAYHIATTLPVSAYQFNALEYQVGLGECSYYSYTNDASLLLPTTTLSGNYLVLSHNSYGPYGSFVTIVAAAAGVTNVMVDLSADITSGAGVEAASAGSTLEYHLQQGEVLQLVSTSSPRLPGYGREDMTGTIIRADQPVSVIAGVDCTNISWPDGTVPACDHLEQQLFPEETWGLDAVVSQLQDRAPTERYIVRILSREDGNVVSFTPSSIHSPVVLNRGQFLEFESSDDFVVTGMRPILVAQYMEGQDTIEHATVGDPSMVLEVPTQQYRRDYNFVIPDTYTASYINVVSRTGAALTLDGHPLHGDTVPVVGSQWLVTRAAVMPGSHILATNGVHGFGLKVLGVANYTSYMYPGGLNLNITSH